MPEREVSGMNLIAHTWAIEVCPICHTKRRAVCEGSVYERHKRVDTVTVEVVASQRLRGAVDVARQIRMAAVGVRARFGEHSGLAAEMDRWASTLDPRGGQ